jgi:hypothetical protein
MTRVGSSDGHSQKRLGTEWGVAREAVGAVRRSGSVEMDVRLEA